MAAYKNEDILLELDRKFGRFLSGENRRMGSGKYTNELYPYSALFSPVSIGTITLKNRVVAVCYDAKQHKEYIDGGIGLLCVPLEYDRSFEGMRRIRNLISDAHKVGACVFAEFSVIDDGQRLPMISAHELRREARAFAEDVLFHGFDGIFLREADAEGLDALKEIRSVTGPNLPVLYDIKLSTALRECFGEEIDDDDNFKSCRKQRSIADTLDYMVKLVLAGVDMFTVGIGSLHNAWLFNPVASLPAGCFLDIAKYVREYFSAIRLKSNAGYDIPVIATGRLAYPDIAEKALRDGMCDLIMLDETPEFDPAWCIKVKQGQCESIIPAAPFASKLREKGIPSECVKNIAVVGGGELGLRFALAAAKRGHTVSVFEMNTQPGGMLRTKCTPMYAYEERNYLEYLLRKCNDAENITLKLGTYATPENLKVKNFDAVVYADGMTQHKPHLPGWGEIPFIFAKDVMMNPESCPDVRGKKVVVLGGARLGSECALYLRNEKGCGKLTLLESSNHICDESSADGAFLLHCLNKAGVRLHPSAAPVYIRDGGVYYEESDGEENTVGFAACELIVVADGWQDSALSILEAKEYNTAPIIERVNSLGSALALAERI